MECFACFQLFFIFYTDAILLLCFFLNLNFCQGRLDLSQALAVLLDQLYLLEFEDLVGVGLLVDFFLLVTIGLLEGGDTLVQLELVDLLLEFNFLCLLQFLFLLNLEGLKFCADFLLECLTPLVLTFLLRQQGHFQVALVLEGQREKGLSLGFTLARRYRRLQLH